MSILKFPSKKSAKSFILDWLEVDGPVKHPTDLELEGFLRTIDYLRTLGTDDDCDICLDGGELFLKVRSYHDYADSNNIESAVKMEKVESSLLFEGDEDMMIGDLVTAQNIEVVKKLLKRVSIDHYADLEKNNEIIWYSWSKHDSWSKHVST